MDESGVTFVGKVIAFLGTSVVGVLSILGLYQTKRGCKTAHTAYDKEQKLERQLITNELGHIKKEQTVQRDLLNKIAEAVYVPREEALFSRRGDR